MIKKKEYVAPQMDVVSVECTANLLENSFTGDVNYYNDGSDKTTALV